jgi:serine/threonine protein kinase
MEEKYNILAKLGEGAYAAVFKVEDKSDGKIYAAKQITNPTDQNALSISELDILGKFNCDYIMSAKEIIYSNDTVYMILPYMSMSLDDLIKSKRNISFEQKVKIMFDIAVGMKTLHNQYYHCDLKPDNILLRDDLSACVADFSLAYSTTIANNGNVCAAKPYRPIEDLTEDNMIISKLNDLWAYGCIVYKLFSGKLLITSDSDVDDFIDDYKSYLEKDLSNPDIRLFLKKVLNIDPEERYQSFDDLLCDPLFESFDVPVCTVKDTEKNFSIPNNPKLYSNLIILSKWLLSVGHKFKMRAQTFVFAIDLLSRSMNSKINSKILQLHGITCLLIASELYEENALSYKTAVYLTGNAYHTNDVKNARLSILKNIGPNIAQRTLYDYAKNLDQLKRIFKLIFNMDNSIFTMSDIDFTNSPSGEVFNYVSKYESTKAEFQEEIVRISDIDNYTLRFIFNL